MRIASSRRLARCALAALLGAADPSAAEPSSPPRAALGADLATFEAPAAAGEPVLPPAPEPVGRLTLRDALAAALLGSPELAAEAYEVRARESAAVQAGLPPNPELDLSVEHFAGTGRYRGFRASESTLQIGQLVELGGKRAARVRLADGERALAAFDWEAKRLDVLTRTTLAFVDLLQAQGESELAVETVRSTRALVAAADARARAGAGTPEEPSRFRVGLAEAEVEQRRARRAVELARLRLAATWGAGAPRFEHAAGDLASGAAPPPLEALHARIAASPDLARWEAELAARRRRVELERSRAVPDVRVGPGIRGYAEDDDAALVLGASVPLPFWNRNQGAVAEARHRLAKSASERRAAEVRLGADLAAAHALAASARAEAEALARDALPQADASRRAVRAAYDAGRLGPLDVLESQRGWTSLRAQRLRALGDHHRGVAEIERILGAPLDAAPAPSHP
jgi:cobalt-zinc-cadmium efflux system outer membrane protein